MHEFNIFLNKIVFGWIKKDLERMKTSIPAKDNEVGNINFPLALCTLAYIEYLGSFLLGKEGNFENNAREYINKCFSRPNEYSVRLLGDIFRHGLAHEYFPRGGIGRNNYRPGMYRIPEIGTVLDVETLVDDFLLSLEKYSKELTYENFNKRQALAFKKIEKKKNKHKQIIDNLPPLNLAPPMSSKYHGSRIGYDENDFITRDPNLK